MGKAGRGAFFCDLDETLYPGLSIKDASRWLLAHGYLSKSNYLRIAWWLFLKRLGKLDDEAAFAVGVKLFAGWKIDDFEQAVAKAYTDALRSKLRPAVYGYVASWKKKGPVILVTETLAPIAAAFARDLGADEVIATELEAVDGRLTGRLAGPVVHGEAKLAALRAWAARQKIDLHQSIGVGGNVEDTPLIASCGRGIVMNPDDALARLARAAGWEIFRF